ncbi:MAG: hypothetical protein K0U47_09210, partial [Epsilonproteobacteria bacterium]|nr:hypothetical protein [Campylobacterota bacterium]
MQVTLNAQTMMLEDIPLDEGYASEKVTAKDMRGKEITFGGQNGKTQIIISAPYLDEENFNEFDQLMKHEDLAIEDVQKYFILSSKADLKSDCDLPLLIDEEEHFGDEFGVRISEAPLKGKLTKALFIVSKDGA